MGLHYYLNYVVIIVAAHVILHCFAFDLNGKFFTGLQQGQGIRQKDQYSLNNANEKRHYYNKYKPLKHSLLWQWKTLESELYNNKYGNHSLRNLKAYTKKQTTTNTLLKETYISLISSYLPKSTTPNYIEFNYFNENQSRHQYSIKRSEMFVTANGTTKFTHFKTNKPAVLDPFMLSHHHCKEPYIRQDLMNPQKAFSENHHNPYYQHINNSKIYETGKPINKTSESDSFSNMPLFGQNAVTVKADLRNRRVPTKTNVSDLIINIPLSGPDAFTVNAHEESTTEKICFKSTRVPQRKSETSSTLLIQATMPIPTTLSTTPDDKVKFFEIYDTNTLKSPKIINESKINNTQLNDMSEKMKPNADCNNNSGGCDVTNTTKIENEHKHKIRRSFKAKSNSAISNQIQGEKVPDSFQKSIVNNTFIFPRESIFSKSEIISKTAVARWHSYPYASVYIYKPTQTHCDAAGISPHWLIAAGSCLSRHPLVHSLHARSAFVTYCGEHWQRPERIAYVKRSVVHPKFNPKDRVRRLLFNIGLIQVSDSMAACPQWSPVVMMSHQFMTRRGSVASAVGWGLDRYGTKYMTEKLPHWPLTVYDAQVYHDTCPGSSTYSSAKRQDGDGTSNVYCLLLPPYTKEESDPVHGGLLLVEGKLVALYLQVAPDRTWNLFRESTELGTRLDLNSFVGEDDNQASHILNIELGSHFHINVFDGIGSFVTLCPSEQKVGAPSQGSFDSQEERRSWGPQSAQYTGVWRLLPWVMEAAREPDDMEAAFDV